MTNRLATRGDFRGHRRLLAALLVLMAMPALDMSLVAITLPQITSGLNDGNWYAWVLTGYLLTLMATTPIYGSLSDRYGRRPLLIFGIGIFVLGTLLCAIAPTMLFLVCCRIFQGIGAGAMQGITQAVVGEVFENVAVRSKALGLLSGVWGVAALLAPLIAGPIMAAASWRFIFLVTVPLGIFAWVMIAIGYRQPLSVQKRGKPDAFGAILLFIASASVSLFLTALQSHSDFSKILGAGLLVLAIVSFLALIRVESTSSQPIIPLEVFRDRGQMVCFISAISLGIIVVITNISVPLFGQAVLQLGAATAGLILAVMSISWTTAAVLSARLYRRTGLALMGSIAAGIICIAGSGLAIASRPGTNLLVIIGLLVALGAGLGPLANILVISIQEMTLGPQLGTVTSLNMLGRSLGQALGAPVQTLVLTITVTSMLKGADRDRFTTTDTIAATLGADGVVADHLRQAIAQGIQWNYLVIAIIGAGTAALLLTLKGRGQVFDPQSLFKG